MNTRGIWLAKSTPEGFLDWGSEYNLIDLRESCRQNPGRTYRLTLVKPYRTLAQNRLYRAYLEIISQTHGGEPDDLHEFFKERFLPKKTVNIKGHKYLIVGSTTELTKLEFTEYMDKICALTEVPIPDPRALYDYLG